MTGYYQTALLRIHATIAIVQQQFQRLRETCCEQHFQYRHRVYSEKGYKPQ